MNRVEEILKNNWNNYEFDQYPIDRRMDILREKEIAGMSTENICLLINELVKNIAVNGTYLEVGIYRGRSIISAALFNPSTQCIGIDNFSESNGINRTFSGKTIDNIPNEEVLNTNLSKFPELNNVTYYKNDCEEELKTLKAKIDVYFYDGNHSYESQIKGLNSILPRLSKNGIIIVDDVNLTDVQNANKKFIGTKIVI